MNCLIKSSNDQGVLAAVKLTLLIVLCCGMSGCILAPFIQAFSDAGVTEGDRQRLLSQSLRGYMEALRWSDTNAAAKYMEPQLHQALFQEARRKRGKERVVEGVVEEVIFSSNGYEADVEILLRTYEIPVFVVKDRVEKHRWNFGVGGGWSMTERTVLKADREAIRAGDGG